LTIECVAWLRIRAFSLIKRKENDSMHSEEDRGAAMVMKVERCGVCSFPL